MGGVTLNTVNETIRDISFSLGCERLVLFRKTNCKSCKNLLSIAMKKRGVSVHQDVMQAQIRPKQSRFDYHILRVSKHPGLIWFIRTRSYANEESQDSATGIFLQITPNAVCENALVIKSDDIPNIEGKIQFCHQYIDEELMGLLSEYQAFEVSYKAVFDTMNADPMIHTIYSGLHRMGSIPKTYHRIYESKNGNPLEGFHVANTSMILSLTDRIEPTQRIEFTVKCGYMRTKQLADNPIPTNPSQKTIDYVEGNILRKMCCHQIYFKVLRHQYYLIMGLENFYSMDHAKKYLGRIGVSSSEVKKYIATMALIGKAGGISEFLWKMNQKTRKGWNQVEFDHNCRKLKYYGINPIRIPYSGRINYLPNLMSLPLLIDKEELSCAQIREVLKVPKENEEGKNERSKKLQ